jgi:ribonuclease HI
MKMQFVGNSDGACRFSQKHASYAAILKDQLGDRYERAGYLKGASNNVAEYHGLIAALELAIENNAHVLKMRLDSELVVRQIKGIYRVSNADLAPLYVRAQFLISKVPTFMIEHVYRNHNTEADALANQVIDNHILNGGAVSH